MERWQANDSPRSVNCHQVVYVCCRLRVFGKSTPLLPGSCHQGWNLFGVFMHRSSEPRYHGRSHDASRDHVRPQGTYPLAFAIGVVMEFYMQTSKPGKTSKPEKTAKPKRGGARGPCCGCRAAVPRTRLRYDCTVCGGEVERACTWTCEECTRQVCVKCAPGEEHATERCTHEDP